MPKTPSSTGARMQKPAVKRAKSTRPARPSVVQVGRKRQRGRPAKESAVKIDVYKTDQPLKEVKTRPVVFDIKPLERAVEFVAELPAKAKRQILKHVIGFTVSVIILVVLAVAAAIAYVWYSGRTPVDDTPLPEAPAQREVNIKAPTPADNAPIGASVTYIDPTVKPGSKMSLNLNTLPTAKCSIVIVDKQKTKIDLPELTDQVADDFGQITWSWAMPISTQPDQWTAQVTCKRADKSAYVEGYFEVK